MRWTLPPIGARRSAPHLWHSRRPLLDRLRVLLGRPACCADCLREREAARALRERLESTRVELAVARGNAEEAWRMRSELAATLALGSQEAQRRDGELTHQFTMLRGQLAEAETRLARQADAICDLTQERDRMRGELADSEAALAEMTQRREEEHARYLTVLRNQVTS